MKTMPNQPFGVPTKTLRRALGITSILLVAVLAFIAISVSTTGDPFQGSGPTYSEETSFEVEMSPPDLTDPNGGYYFEGHVTDPNGAGIANATVLVYRNTHPADERLVLAPVPKLGFGRAVPGSTDPRFGPTFIDTVQTDDSGYYRASVDKYEKVEVLVAATGYHLQDTRIVPALGVQQVDIKPIPENEPAPRPVENAPYVLPEGFHAAGAALLTSQDELKARAVASLQCHGIDVTAADITGDITSTNDFTGAFKTSVRVRSDDCSSVEARTISYDKVDAKTVPTTKGTFTLVNSCANLIIPAPKIGFVKVFKFDDLDGDGTWDSGEQGLPGFKFRITGEGKDFLVTTGAGGVFITGWKATTPTTRTVNVTDGQLAEVGFGNQQLPTPPAVDVTGKKVELVDDGTSIKEFAPLEQFTFEIVGKGITTQTQEDGTFRFENVELFTVTGPDTVSVKICEQLPSSIWVKVDPPDGCKTKSITKGTTLVDFGVWKNATTKNPGPEVTPTPTPPPGASPTPTPAPTVSPTPTPTPGDCLVTILGPNKIKSTTRQAKIGASIQWDRPPNFTSPEFRWYLDGQLLVHDAAYIYYLDGGKAVTFWTQDLTTSHTLRVDVLKSGQVICSDETPQWTGGTVPPQ